MSLSISPSRKLVLHFRGQVELITGEDIDLTTNQYSGKTFASIQFVSGTDEERKQAIAETLANLPKTGNEPLIMRHRVNDYVDVEANIAKLLFECAHGFVNMAAKTK